MGLMLGGGASPVGWWVSFLDVPATTAVDVVTAWRRGLGQQLDVLPWTPFPDSLALLDPLERPWKTELLIDCGTWTAYLNNQTDGGDPTSAAPYLAQRLGVRCIVAGHSPLHGPGHGGTQLWVLGPDGEPPLMYRRTVGAVATDGRWEWDVSGEPFAFERLDRYAERRIRDRFDRALLLEYLGAWGIAADDDTFYGPGCAVRQRS